MFFQSSFGGTRVVSIVEIFMCVTTNLTRSYHYFVWHLTISFDNLWKVFPFVSKFPCDVNGD